MEDCLGICFPDRCKNFIYPLKTRKTNIAHAKKSGKNSEFHVQFLENPILSRNVWGVKVHPEKSNPRGVTFVLVSCQSVTHCAANSSQVVNQCGLSLLPSPSFSSLVFCFLGVLFVGDFLVFLSVSCLPLSQKYAKQKTWILNELRSALRNRMQKSHSGWVNHVSMNAKDHTSRLISKRKRERQDIWKN